MTAYDILRMLGSLPTLALCLLGLKRRGQGANAMGDPRENAQAWPRNRQAFDLVTLDSRNAVRRVFEASKERAQVVFDHQSRATYYVVNAHLVNEICNKAVDLMDAVKNSGDAAAAEVALLRLFHDTGFTMLRDLSVPYTDTGEIDLTELLARSSIPNDRPITPIGIGVLEPIPSLK